AALANVYPDDRSARAGTKAPQPTLGPESPGVVEAHPVDDGAVSDQSKQARARVSLLWQRRDRANLDVAEAEGRQTTNTDGVLVEPGRDPERRGELPPECAHGEGGVWGRDPSQQPRNRRRAGDANDEHPQVVRELRIQAREHCAK